MIPVDQPWFAPVTVALISSIGTLILGWINRNKLQELHVEINSRMTQLIEANSRADRAEGVMSGSADRAAIRAMIEEIIASRATHDATAAAAALVSDEARAVAIELKGTATDTAVHLAKDTPAHAHQTDRGHFV